MGKKERVTITGTVTLAYNPKRDSDRFFYKIEEADGTDHKGMAGIPWMPVIAEGATVDVEGYESRGWFNMEKAVMVTAPVYELEQIDLDLGYVTAPKITHYGWGCRTNVHGTWVTITCRALTEYLEGKAEDVPYNFPNQGHGYLIGQAHKNGDVVVEKIDEWHPITKAVVLDIPFSSVRWFDDQVSVPVDGQRAWIDTDRLPFVVVDGINYADMVAILHVEGTLVKVGHGWHNVNWEWDDVTVTVSGDMAETIKRLVYDNTVTAAIQAVREQIADLTSKGVVVDETAIMEFFLAQGIKPDADTVRKAFLGNYDGRYLDALKGLGAKSIWRVGDGFMLHIENSLVWERCGKQRAATYIIPDQPDAELVGENLTVAQWAAVAAQIMAESKKMALRYGEIGQALTRTVEGVQFAFRVKDDEGNIDGWLQRVRDGIDTKQTRRGDVLGLPSIDELMLMIVENN